MARNKEKTKEKILAAARDILAREGFAALKVNRLADAAGVGKPLIYRYFGSMDNIGLALLGEIKSDGLGRSGFDPDTMANTDAVLKSLVYHGRALSDDRLARDLLIWSLGSGDSPHHDDVRPVTSTSEGAARGAVQGEDPAAVFALLKAAIAFIVLARDHHTSFAGLALETARDMARLEYAMAAVVKKMWPQCAPETKGQA